MEETKLELLQRQETSVAVQPVAGIAAKAQLTCWICLSDSEELGECENTYSAAGEEGSKRSSVLSKSGGHHGGGSKDDNSSGLHFDGYVYDRSREEISKSDGLG